MSGFGGASSPVSFSTRTAANGCSSPHLTAQEVDHLRTELAKVSRLVALTQGRKDGLITLTVLPGVMLHRWRRKSRLCGRSSWSRRRTRRTSGGSWVWDPSATSNRTCPKAGTTSRAQPRECHVCWIFIAVSTLGYVTARSTLMTSHGCAPLSDTSQPPPPWRTSATLTCEPVSSALHILT